MVGAEVGMGGLVAVGLGIEVVGTTVVQEVSKNTPTRRTVSRRETNRGCVVVNIFILLFTCLAGMYSSVIRTGLSVPYQKRSLNLSMRLGFQVTWVGLDDRRKMSGVYSYAF